MQWTETSRAVERGCAGAERRGRRLAQEELKIGMVNLSLCCAYFVGMDAAVKDEATHFSNVTVLSTDAGGRRGEADRRTSRTC